MLFIQGFPAELLGSAASPGSVGFYVGMLVNKLWPPPFLIINIRLYNLKTKSN